MSRRLVTRLGILAAILALGFVTSLGDRAPAPATPVRAQTPCTSGAASDGDHCKPETDAQPHWSGQFAGFWQQASAKKAALAAQRAAHAAIAPLVRAPATLFVNAGTTGNDSGPNNCLTPATPCKTITHALTQSINGDTISVAAGTYSTASNGEAFPLDILNAVTIAGAGSSTTTVDATGSGSSVFTVNSSGGAVTLSGLTITNGGDSGVFVSQSSPLSLTNDVITKNASGGGAGLLLDGGGDLTMNNVTVSSNTSTRVGGGLYLESGGNVTITNSTISGNTAGTACSSCGGGGMKVGQSGATSLTISNSTISGNTTDPSCASSCTGGGGIRVTGDTSSNLRTLTLQSVTVTGNSASPDCTSGCGDGGGIALDACSATLTISNSTLNGNTSHEDGGAIDSDCSATVAISSSTLSGNSGDEGALDIDSGDLSISTGTLSGNSGGGDGVIDFEGNNMTIVNSTIANNVVASNGDGIIEAEGSTATIQFSTIAGNTSFGFGGIQQEESSTVGVMGTILANNGTANCSGTISSLGYNVVSDSSCGLTGAGDLSGVDPRLGALQNNGGTTSTMLPGPGSPAIDHIPSPSVCPPPATDQRGVLRPVGPACDSGAVETTVSSGGGFIIQPPAPSSPTPSPTPAATQTATGTPTATPTPTPGCATVSYAAGYNLAGAPSGTVLSGAAGSLFSLAPGATSYTSLPVTKPLSGGVGVWAFFFTPATVTLPCVSKQTLTVTLPAGVFVLVGNPGDTTATLSGADFVDTFNATTQSYVTTKGTATLPPGQGAWAFSAKGGSLTITNQ